MRLEDCVAAPLFQHSLLSHYKNEVAASLSSLMPWPAALTSPGTFWEKTLRLLVHDYFCCLFKYDVWSPTTCGPGQMKHTCCISRKRNNNILEKCVDFDSNTSFFMSFSLPESLVKGCLSLKFSNLKALYLPKT